MDITPHNANSVIAQYCAHIPQEATFSIKTERICDGFFLHDRANLCLSVHGYVFLENGVFSEFSPKIPFFYIALDSWKSTIFQNELIDTEIVASSDFKTLMRLAHSRLRNKIKVLLVHKRSKQVIHETVFNLPESLLDMEVLTEDKALYASRLLEFDSEPNYYSYVAKKYQPYRIKPDYNYDEEQLRNQVCMADRGLMTGMELCKYILTSNCSLRYHCGKYYAVNSTSKTFFEITQMVFAYCFLQK